MNGVPELGEPLALHKGLKKAGSLRLSLCKDAVSCFPCSLEPVPVLQLS